MRQPKILVFSGSIRSGSYNTQLAAAAVKLLALADTEVTRISLKDYPLPLYDGDLEKQSGQPENAKKLKNLFQTHDGIFIACPEYNAGITPLLKNTLDWVSRVSEAGDPPAAGFKKSVFALGAASPGALGGMRGLIGTRTILEVGLGALVLPQMVTVPAAGQAFDKKGDLEAERSAAQLQNVVDELLGMVKLRLLR